MVFGKSFKLRCGSLDAEETGRNIAWKKLIWKTSVKKFMELSQFYSFYHAPACTEENKQDSFSGYQETILLYHIRKAFIICLLSLFFFIGTLLLFVMERNIIMVQKASPQHFLYELLLLLFIYLHIILHLVYMFMLIPFFLL